MRAIAAAIWNQDIADSLDMNDDVMNVIATAAGQALECSKALALLPMPAGFPPLKLTLWLLLNSASVVRRLVGVSQNRRFRACIVTAAASYRSALELASQGI